MSEQLFDPDETVAEIQVRYPGLKINYGPVLRAEPRCCNCGTSWSWHWSEHKGYPVCGRCLGMPEPTNGGDA